ncbi:hypothetical protein CDEST_13591 [Colletotrichum destructivum]|uniref:Uncharacterized protein n=1 Tax=Colletotrichum destructivum TaxID=34406 RepID=A0AAX4IZM3_9PEZI|nr:hypothetical protein CDEST_13591 [Colletotrichum destructivum]
MGFVPCQTRSLSVCLAAVPTDNHGVGDVGPPTEGSLRLQLLPDLLRDLSGIDIAYAVFCFPHVLEEKQRLNGLDWTHRTQ